MENIRWKRLNQGPIDEPILEYLEKLIKEELSRGINVTVGVGTDAQRRSRGHKFAIVIAVMTEGKGGKVIYYDYMDKNKMTMNEKLLKEVYKSIEVAYEISPILDKYGIKAEVHIDINGDPKWPSNTSLSQAMGYVKGMGYDCKYKPDSYIATHTADMLSKK